MAIKGKVLICRQPGDWRGGAYEAGKIKGVKWDCVSGGVFKRQNGWSLYGYIPYEDAMELVACSGVHNYGYNPAKICITASGNKDDPQYRAAYYGLVEKADERGKCGLAEHCPPGKPMCTKRIREIMYDVGVISRGELKKTLIEEGYDKTIVAESIKNLHCQSILEFEGDSRSSKQIIRYIA